MVVDYLFQEVDDIILYLTSVEMKDSYLKPNSKVGWRKIRFFLLTNGLAKEVYFCQLFCRQILVLRKSGEISNPRPFYHTT